MPHFSECICVVRRHFALCGSLLCMHNGCCLGLFRFKSASCRSGEHPSPSSPCSPWGWAHQPPTTTTAPSADCADVPSASNSSNFAMKDQGAKHYVSTVADGTPCGSTHRSNPEEPDNSLETATCFLVERPNKVFLVCLCACMTCHP